jgi:hypothetical protein
MLSPTKTAVRHRPLYLKLEDARSRGNIQGMQAVLAELQRLIRIVFGAP